jgi:hypothetical protein
VGRRGTRRAHAFQTVAAAAWAKSRASAIVLLDRRNAILPTLRA